MLSIDTIASLKVEIEFQLIENTIYKMPECKKCFHKSKRMLRVNVLNGGSTKHKMDIHNKSISIS